MLLTKSSINFNLLAGNRHRTVEGQLELIIDELFIAMSKENEFVLHLMEGSRQTMIQP